MIKIVLMIMTVAVLKVITAKVVMLSLMAIITNDDTSIARARALTTTKWSNLGQDYDSNNVDD